MLSRLQPGNESSQGLPSLQNRRKQQQQQSTLLSGNVRLPANQVIQPPAAVTSPRRSLYTFPLPSQKLCEAWARSSSISHPRAQDRTQHTVGSLLMSARQWEAKMACFSCFSFIFMGFWKCILHFFNYFSSISKKVFGYCFLKRWFTDKNNLHTDPRVGCFWGLCPQGDKRPSPRGSLTYKWMSHLRGPERQA